MSLIINKKKNCKKCRAKNQYTKRTEKSIMNFTKTKNTSRFIQWSFFHVKGAQRNKK
uniref:Uncharacterized protein n=1 Tax=Meloidogyne enterolobii TaxID=390850 RepID=A0A6V7VJ97_MELEN|nr:unnamed protein product [Meloidogyne enterolobii]